MIPNVMDQQKILCTFSKVSFDSFIELDPIGDNFSLQYRNANRNATDESPTQLFTSMITS